MSRVCDKEIQFPIAEMKWRLLVLALFVADVSSQCLDEHGDHADWVILYKFPELEKEGGLDYAYLSSNQKDVEWTLSKRLIDDPESIPGRILAPLYDPAKRNQTAFVFYNDEHPDGNTSFTDGHTKGVVGFNEKNGFWLVHSVPKFPTADVYGYPHTGRRYGQSFLCISLGTVASIDKIGVQLMYNHPFVYSYNVPKWASKYVHFALASGGNHITKPPYYNVLRLKSLSGLSFTSFAKYTTFGKDLYADLVAPALKTNLMVESWPNGAGKMNSSCSTPFHVMNIDELNFKQLRETFTTRHDHAKWAVSTNVKASRHLNDNILCIGDINRMNTQKKRAGGTVCFRHKGAWKSFTKIIQRIENCPITY